MDELELKRLMDDAIRQAIDAGRKPRLIQLCRVQSAAAERLQTLYEGGVITRYAMPSVIPDPAGDGVTVRADFDYAEAHT